jgi:hypothetical protein
MPKNLGAASPAAATDQEIYAPASGLGARNLRCHVAETNGVDSVFTLFHETDGAVFDDASTIYEDTILANTTKIIKLTHIEMSDSNHGFGVESVTGDVTFTLYGDEFAV